MVEDWFDRVVYEAADLTAKIRKLREFRKTEAYSILSEKHKELLEQQYTVMCAYCIVLNERIGLEID